MGIMSILFEDGDKKEKEVKGKKAKGEEVVAQEAPAPVQQAAAPVQPAAAPVQPQFSAPNQVFGQIDEGMKAKIIEEIEKNNLSGPDYFEFMKALEAMASVPMQENLKYQSAFATLSTQGLTKEYLTESVAHYLKIIETEKEIFHKDIAGHKAGTVDVLANEMVELNTIISNKLESIAEMQTQINEIKNALVTKQQELNEKEVQIATVSANFDVTSQDLSTKIQGDLQKITTFLQ